MEVTKFGGKGEYIARYIQLWLKVGLIASLACFHVVKTEVAYHVLLGQPWLHKHHIIPSMYHQYVKGRHNDRMMWIVANPSPFEQAKAHLVETMFYDKWAPFGESSISKPLRTFVPQWKDVEKDLEPNLRELLSQKRKRRETSTSSSNSFPCCVRVKAPDSRITYKLWRWAGPTYNMQRGPWEEP